MANLRFVNLRREALRKAFGSEPTNRSANFRRRPNLHVLALSASRYNLGTRCVAGSGSFWAFPRARRQAGRRRVATTLRSPPIRRGVPVQKESVSPGRVVVVGGRRPRESECDGVTHVRLPLRPADIGGHPFPPQRSLPAFPLMRRRP